MALYSRRWASLGLAAASFFSTASATNLSFTNCLGSPSNITNVPFLQFTVSAIEATFDLSSSTDNNLNITVYGNFSGNFEGNTNLPSLDNTSYWSNPNLTSGKITDLDPNSKTDKFSTLFAKYYVATNIAESHIPTEFCHLTRDPCPISPAAIGASGLDSLPSFSVTQSMYNSWGFASINPVITVNAGNQQASQIICVSTEATPYLGNAPANLLRYLPVGVLLLTFVATASAAFSPWGTFNIYHWSSNYGRDEDQLRLITPGFGDCLAYIQFIVFSGSLALVYPGYYQPTVSQVSWSTLMFNQSFYGTGTGINPIVDGLYTVNQTWQHPINNLGTYNGLTRMRQLIGMETDNDIWPGMIIWLLVVLAALLVIIQLTFVFRLVYRLVTKTQEEDLRAKNWPFSVGNVIRVVFNYFLLPLITFCVYQMALLAAGAPASLGAPAVVTVIILLAFSGWLLFQILSTNPREFLFDDLSTLLMYGPLYNTYSDAAAPFALIPMLVNLFRGIAIGGIQASGIAQIVVLAIVEVFYVLALNAFRPFSSPTSMNLYHTAFALVRLVVLLLMLAFAHEVNAAVGIKAWIGYVILFLHGLVLFFGFFIHSLQTLVEVMARALGAGGEGSSVQRGGLVKVFGVRQLSRRNPRRTGRARGSMASEAAMLDHQPMEHGSEAGRQSGMRSRSMSASSAFLLNSRAAGSGRQSLALDTFSQGAALDGAPSSAGQSRGPGTPSGAPSVLSYSAGASQAGYDARRASAMAFTAQKPVETAGPYYRPPRARRATNEALGSPATHGRSSAASGDWTKRASTRASGSDEYDGETGGDSGAPSPAYLGYNRARADSRLGANAELEDPDAPKPDYATREVDYYYGVRGPALNDQPTRKLKTGPADPTGPVSSATGWFQKVFGGKTKDKHKGFEVVRGKGIRQGMQPVPTEEPEASPRDLVDPYTDEPGTPIPAATTAPRKLDLEDETDAIGAGTRRVPGEEHTATSPLDELGVARSPENAPVLPGIDAGDSIHVPSRFNSQVSRSGNSVRYRDDDVPVLPRSVAGRPPGVDIGLNPAPRSAALSTIAQSPSPSGSPTSARQPYDAISGGLSRMPFGSLGSGTSEHTRPSIAQRAGSTRSGVSNTSHDNDRRPSYQSPPSPIQAPRQLIDTSETGHRRQSASSIGYVSQHRASDHIVNPPSQALFGGSQAELVSEDGLERAPSSSPAPKKPDPRGAHINF